MKTKALYVLAGKSFEKVYLSVQRQKLESIVDIYGLLQTIESFVDKEV